MEFPLVINIQMCYIFQIISHDSYDLSQFFVKVVVYCQTEYFSVLGPVIGSVFVRVC